MRFVWLVLAWGLLVAGSPQSFRFVHITDTHIGLRAHHEPTRAFVQHFNALEPQPAFIVNTGDCTELGFAEEYQHYRAILGELRARLISVPGNHDVRWSPIGKEGFVRYVAPLRQHWEYGGCHFFALDSTAPLEHHGHFEPADLEWLADQLRRLPKDAPVFLFCHHWVARDDPIIDNEQRLLQIIEPYNVKAVFVGHGHRDEMWRRNGTLFLMAKGLYQGSYHLVEVDLATVRVFRVTQENPAPTEVAVLPRARLPKPRLAIRRLTTRQGVLQMAMEWHSPDGRLPTEWQVRFGDGRWQPLVPRRRGGHWLARVEVRDAPPGALRVTVRALVETEPYEASRTVRLAGQVRPIWTFRTGGSVKAQPVVHRGIVYVSSFDGNLYALDAASGRLRWRTAVGGSLVAAPIVSDKWIVVGSTSGAVVCLSRADGRIRWRAQLPPPVFATAAVQDGVVCTAGGDGKIYGLSLEDGTLLWQFQTEMFVQSRVATAQGLFLVGCWDNHLYALEARTGALRWKQKFGRSFYYAPAIGSPATDGGRVIVPSNDATLHAVRVSDGAILWQIKSERGNSFGYPSPLLRDGIVYCGALGGRGLLYAIHARTGEPLWIAELGKTMYDTGVAAAQGYLFTASVSGRVFWIEQRTGTIVAQYQLPEGHIFCVPDTDGKRFFIGSLNGEVYAFPVLVRNK
ncbi:MAG: PQQ-binding-like beta-propeller repeat protein [Fimbriimonadales bacterium]|nr:PQQ-binding-like beta-propeller repeat protein [Fimbriimonadales bacterium]